MTLEVIIKADMNEQWPEELQAANEPALHLLQEIECGKGHRGGESRAMVEADDGAGCPISGNSFARAGSRK